MSRKVTIIGAGNVGSTIAYTMAVTGLTSEIVMIDVNTAKALGETMDIRQGTPFIGPVYVHDGDYEDARDSDIVVFTSAVALVVNTCSKNIQMKCADKHQNNKQHYQNLGKRTFFHVSSPL